MFDDDHLIAADARPTVMGSVDSAEPCIRILAAEWADTHECARGEEREHTDAA